jgi:ice-binding like protein
MATQIARFPLRMAATVGLLVATVIAVTITDGGAASAAQAPVGLGTAASFAVLAGSTVTNTGPSVISGDVGVSPGSAITGFGPGIVENGTVHAADGVANGAQADTTIAYNDAAGRTPVNTVTGDLGGQTLVAGVYSGGALGLTGTVTLNAQGNPNAVFIFQAASTLITSSTSVVALEGDASACNVFWKVGSSATLGTGSTFVGTIMALTSISATTGTTVAGRLLARNGAVTLDTNTITAPICSSPPTTTTTVAATTIPVTATTTPVTPTTRPGTTTVSSSTTSTAGAGTSTGTGGGGGATSGGGGATTGGGGATVTKTGPLAGTGTNAEAALTTGLLAIGLGGLALLASRRPRRTRT